MGFQRLVLCIDEGERIDPYALSALKNALLELDEYLVVLSIRLAEDHGDPVRAGKVRLEEKAAEADRDLGAARLFVGGVGLGAFTDSQARQCITRRLEGNVVQFDGEVMDQVVRVAAGWPDKIISYAYEVYDRTVSAGVPRATTAIFRQTFMAMHQLELEAARALSAQSTNSDRRVLHEFARHDGPLTPADLAARLYSGVPADALEPVAEALKGVLDRVGDTLSVSIDGRLYSVPDPVRRYALEISMEPQ